MYILRAKNFSSNRKAMKSTGWFLKSAKAVEDLDNDKTLKLTKNAVRANHGAGSISPRNTSDKTLLRVGTKTMKHMGGSEFPISKKEFLEAMRKRATEQANTTFKGGKRPAIKTLFE